MSKTKPAGDGGETCHRASDDRAVLTPSHGGPISDNQNSLESWSRGAILIAPLTLQAPPARFIPRATYAAFAAATARRFDNREPSLRTLV